MNRLVAVTVILLISFSFARRPVDIKSGTTYIYKTKAGKAIRDSLSQGQGAFLLQEGANLSKIKTDKGVVGWVHNSAIEYVKTSLGNTYDLENQDVRGWLDNPTAVYILDHPDIGIEAVLLIRSFRDEIFEFIDREQLERTNNEN
jgi:hypothetical protein